MPINNKKSCKRALHAIEQTHWAILPQSLNRILSIAQRSYSDPNLATELRNEYAARGAVEHPDKVAVIDVCGPIFTRADLFSDISGACSIEGLEEQLDQALYDDAITAIVLRFDSPGGHVTGTHEFANYIREACEIKTIVAYVSGMACSAAYWLCCATSHVFADRTAILGSIGVVAAWTDDSKAKNDAGLVDYEVVSSQSPNKRLSMDSKEGKAALQKELDGLAEIFINDVAACRGVTADIVVSDFGSGGTMLADESIAVGMADEISSLREVINQLSDESSSSAVITTTGNNNMAGKYKSAAQRRAEEDKREESRRKAKAKAKAKKAEGEDDEQPDAEEDDEQLDATDDDEQTDADEEDDVPVSKKSRRAEGDDSKEPIEDDEELEEDAEEEDEETETASTNRAVRAFAKKNPGIYNAVIRRGARRERRRIAGIEDLKIVGHSALIERCKFDKPLSASATSLAVIKAERHTREQLKDDYESDANAIRVRSSGQRSGSGSSNQKKNLLAQVLAGAGIKGKKS